MKELYELRDALCDELREYGKKGVSGSTLDVIDKLTHTIKNLDKIIEVNGYSGRYPYEGHRDSYTRRGGMYGYSRTNIKDRLHELMDEAGDDRTREEIKRLIDKM